MVQKSGSDWRSRTLSEVAAKVGNQRRGRYASRLNIEIPFGGLLALLTEAAARRDCSPTTYARRAMMSFIADDLGIPFETVAQLDPRFTGPAGNNAIHDPGGELGGPWGIR